MNNEIEIENIGAIQHLRFKMDLKGCVRVLHAKNGKGKSTALETVDALVSGRVLDATPHDGVIRGSASAFGARITLGRRTSRSGELEVVSLEGRMSIADLVDPKLKSPEAADAKRIKALIQVASGENAAKPEKFYKLVGGKKRFAELVSADSLNTNDLVTMASRIKGDLEKQAREYESKAEKTFAKASQAAQGAAGINTDLPYDEEELASNWRKATIAESRIVAQSEAAETAITQATKASELLKQAEKGYTGLTPEDASAKLMLAEKEVEDSYAEVKRLRELVTEAQNVTATAEHKRDSAKRELKTAESHVNTVAEYLKIVNDEVPEPVNPKRIEQYKALTAAAQSAVQQGAVIRSALKSLDEAEKLKKEAILLESEGDKIRAAAQDTDSVLSAEVEKLHTPLRVKYGRLVLDTDRGETFFSELSPGERYHLVIHDIAVPTVGKGGIIVLPQDAWEALDPINRRLVAEAVENTGVCILTAEASDDEEIVVEDFEANPFPDEVE